MVTDNKHISPVSHPPYTALNRLSYSYPFPPVLFLILLLLVLLAILDGLGCQGAHGISKGLIDGIHTWKVLQDTLRKSRLLMSWQCPHRAQSLIRQNQLTLIPVHPWTYLSSPRRRRVIM